MIIYIYDIMGDEYHSPGYVRDSENPSIIYPSNDGVTRIPGSINTEPIPRPISVESPVLGSYFAGKNFNYLDNSSSINYSNNGGYSLSEESITFIKIIIATFLVLIFVCCYITIYENDQKEKAISEEIKEFDEKFYENTKATELDPNNYDAWREKGEELLELYRFDDAAYAFSQATRLKPDDAISWSSEGYAYYKAGHKDLAIKTYEEGIKHDPANETFMNENLAAWKGTTR